MADVYVAAGSNVEPEKNLARALDELEENFGALAISPAYRNPPVGFAGEDFINLVVGFHTADAPGQVKEKLERVDIELPEFTTTLGIDPATGHVINQTYRGRGPGGVVGQIVINYSDFRTVEGLSLPFKTTATFDGQPFPALSGTIEAITINAQIDPSAFKKPEAKQ